MVQSDNQWSGTATIDTPDTPSLSPRTPPPPKKKKKKKKIQIVCLSPCNIFMAA